ncbi:hypothetical protein [Streptomyces sp. NPDC008092]|uniref:hypothetical protein n=1 Tax=Streptomyces sp. NPDC008092 TaxID=3364808 RepID=UPI0036F01B85
MKTTVTFRDMSGADPVRRRVEQRVTALQPHLDEDGTAQVALSADGHAVTVEIGLRLGQAVAGLESGIKSASKQRAWLTPRPAHARPDGLSAPSGA